MTVSTQSIADVALAEVERLTALLAEVREDARARRKTQP